MIAPSYDFVKPETQDGHSVITPLAYQYIHDTAQLLVYMLDVCAEEDAEAVAAEIGVAMKHFLQYVLTRQETAE